MPRMRDVVAAAVLLLVGLAAFVEGRGLPFGAIAAPGPGFFPLVVATTLAGVSLILLARAVASRPAPVAVPVPPDARLRLAAVVAALFAFTAVLEPLGFLAATFLLMVVLFRVVEGHRWTIVVAESAAAAVASHVLFKTWLGVRLPPGPWGF
jgi:putative tricarboxylic transport membrane protein